MIEQETLNEALNYTLCTELPAVAKKETIWVRAIALVKKCNNHECYCIVENDGFGKAIIKKDFGSIAQISEILAIYPLSVLQKSSFPDLRKKEDITKYLVRNGVSAEKVAALMSANTDESKAEIKQLIYSIAIQIQLINEKNAQNIAEREKARETQEQETNDNSKETENDHEEDSDNLPESED